MASERDVLLKAAPLRTLRAYMDEHLKPEARDKVLRKAATEFPSETAHLGERPPLVTERVPVLLVNRLVELTAEELHEPATVIAHRVGRRSAEEASRGILRLAMILISMPSLLRKLTPTWSQMYTHGTMSSHSEGRSATIELTGFPVKSVVGCARVTGTFEWFAGQAEKSATVTHSVCQAKNGGDVCKWEVHW
ncbi:MAG: hypothetical protein ABI837_09230 [Acidobacteriota bacterium]